MLKVHRKLDEEQQEAVKFLYKRNKGLCIYGTGTGKSTIMICLSHLLIEHEKVNKIFIVSTNTACGEIANDFKEILGGEIQIWKSGKELQKYNLVPYSMVKKLLNSCLLRGSKHAFLFDEVHTIKNKDTAVTKNCRKLRRYGRYLYGFTATPMTREPKDIYYVTNFFDKTVFGTWTEFVKKYTYYYKIPSVSGFDILKPYKYKNLDLMFKTLRQLAIVYTPDYDIRWVSYKVPLEDIKTYKKIGQGHYGNKFIEHTPARLRYLKKHVQLCKGKLKKFLAICKKYSTNGLIVYCENYDVIYKVIDLLRHFNFEVYSYLGRQTKNVRNKNRKAFSDNPNGKILVISKVGAQSLNLQVTNEMLVLDIPFSVGGILQLMGRVARKYSKYKYYNIRVLFVEGSIEEYQFKYITLYNNILRDVLANKLTPDGIPSYSEHLKKSLAKDLLWKE